jgi:hypothetical protein
MSKHGGDLTLSLRECRLVMERIMQLSGVPAGVVPAARDCAIYSEALRLGGFTSVRSTIAGADWAKVLPLQVADSATGLTVDCGSQHAWLVAHGIADLLLEQGTREVLVRNVTEQRELRVIEAIGQAHCVAVDLSARAASGPVRITCRSERVTEGLSVLERIREQGLVVSAALWWDLFELSNGALATDTPLSRQHAGPIKVAADGSIIGQLDDAEDTDPSLLVGQEGGRC